MLGRSAGPDTANAERCMGGYGHCGRVRVLQMLPTGVYCRVTGLPETSWMLK